MKGLLCIKNCKIAVAERTGHQINGHTAQTSHSRKIAGTVPYKILQLQKTPQSFFGPVVFPLTSNVRRTGTNTNMLSELPGKNKPMCTELV